MASAFASGFRMGGDMYDQAERNRLAKEELGLAKERDARAAEVHRQAVEEFGWRRDANARLRTQDEQVDALTKQLTDPNAGNFALAPRGTGMGLRMGNQPAAESPAEGLSVPQLVPDAAAPGLRMRAPPVAQVPAEGLSAPQLVSDAPATGLRAPAMPERQMTFNQAPTGAAAEDLLGRIALIRGDTAGFRGSQAAARTFREDDLFKERVKGYKGTPEQIDETMVYVNQMSKSITMGEPDKDGFAQLSVVKPDGKAVFANLTRQDQAKIYAAAGLMELNPQRAFDMMAQVNKDLAVAVAADNNMNVSLANASNDVVSKKGTLANQRAKLGIDREELDVKRALANAQARYYDGRTTMEKMGSAEYFTGNDGNTYAAIPTRDKNGRVTFENVRVNPDNVKLTQVGKGAGPSKPVEAPAQGKIMLRDGKRYITDGLGNEIELNARGKPLGVMPEDRDNYIAKTLGMTPVMAKELEFSKDGRFILVRKHDVEYDTQDPEDMKRIKDDMKAFTAQDPVDYENRMLLGRRPTPTGFGPRITFPPPRAEGDPGIYASPEARAAFRAKQQQQ